MKKVMLSVICLAFVTTLLGCGTIKGFGDDISAVGGWLKKGSESVKEGGK